MFYDYDYQYSYNAENGYSYLYILLRHICTSIIIDSALFYHVAADLFYSHYSHSLPCNYA